jgi:hypothetical protein
MSRLYLSNPCAFFHYTLAHGAAGAVGARLSLCPLQGEGQRDAKPRENQSAGTIALTLTLFEIRIRVFSRACPVLWRWLAVIPGRAKREP